MILAWALDQVIDLNNGLDVSHPLRFKEELICLTTVFSYSICCLVLGITSKLLCEKDDPRQEEESISTFMTVSFLLLGVFLPINTLVRTSLDTVSSDAYQHLQNLLLAPLVSLAFILTNL
jgi:hypothetical protein